MAKSPAKAGFLGVACLVAVYFWVPLIWKWAVPPKPASAAPAVAATPVTPATTSNAVGELATSATPVETTHPWDQLRAWMERDARMTSAPLRADQRNPFVHVHNEQVAEQEHEDGAPPGEETSAVVEAPPDPEVTPETLGLVLHSTVVSPRLKLAKINGRTYEEKATVVVSGANDSDEMGREQYTSTESASETDNGGEGRSSTGITFTLLEVHPQQVVLERNGKTYTLRLRRLQINSGNRIVLRGSSAGRD